MASGKETTGRGFLGELLQTDIYKRTQGRWTRQLTGFIIAGAIAVAGWQIRSSVLGGASSVWRIWVPLFVVMGGCWIAYRVVNTARFADFLIAVEAEMSKVTWPSRQELWRSSMVVIVTIFALAAVLLFFDFAWITLLKGLGVIRGG